ncbi:MAG: PepSY domain-containing protein [Clostridia bacterium]|nr:PepSY domain-containing protein [Clostridia bacterium]
MFNPIHIKNRFTTKTWTLLIAVLLVALMVLTAVACDIDEIPPKDAISADAAKQIALEHAGLTAADVVMDRADYDLDDGVPEYEIEFRQGRVEYDYVIHALTGEVLFYESEGSNGAMTRPAQDPAATPISAEPASDSVQEISTPTAAAPSADLQQRITAAQAEQIAQKDAGLAATEVTLQRTEFDYDDGAPAYEIEFYQQRSDTERVEYDYTIHAVTGAILAREVDVDRIPDASAPSTPAPVPDAPDAAAQDRISSTDAEQIARSHAGVTAADVIMQRTELDYDDGLLVYEVEFRQGYTEYDYTIHARTGEILSYHKEQDRD